MYYCIFLFFLCINMGGDVNFDIDGLIIFVFNMVWRCDFFLCVKFKGVCFIFCFIGDVVLVLIVCLIFIKFLRLKLNLCLICVIMDIDGLGF